MRMTIVKGKPFQADFVVKLNGSTNALPLNIADTGKITFYTNGVNPEKVLIDISMIQQDASNGKFRLNLTAEQTAVFETKIGFAEDGYPVEPTYKALAEFNTVNQGYMMAEVSEIYIVDMGS
jgi:hypothetical protein